MRSAALILIACLIWVSPAESGPWPRGKGHVFVSSSAFATWPAGRSVELPDIYGTAFAEFGLTDRVTLGLDFGTADYQKSSRSKAIALVRYTLSAPGASLQSALEIGGGMDQGRTVLQIGGSLGRGLSIGKTSGWATADAKLLHSPSIDETAYGLDLTVGINQPRTKYIAQLSALQSYSGKPFVSFVPSVVRQIGKHSHVELGASIGLKNKPDPALKLGIWREF